jgi:hypothetical protein
LFFEATFREFDAVFADFVLAAGLFEVADVVVDLEFDAVGLETEVAPGSLVRDQ